MWTFSWEISKNFQSVIFKDVFGRYFWDGLIERQPSESISKTNDICLKLLTNYLPTSAYVTFHQKESHPPSSQLIFFFITYSTSMSDLPINSRMLHEISMKLCLDMPNSFRYFLGTKWSKELYTVHSNMTRLSWWQPRFWMWYKPGFSQNSLLDK